MIRLWDFSFAFALMMVCLGTVVAQEDTLSPSPIPTGAFASTADDATLEAKVFRAEIARGIIEAAQKSDKLTRFEKRRIERVMQGGWLYEGRKQSVITSVVQQLHAEQAIVVTPDGVQAAVDWENVLSIVAKLIPLIVQLISLFGAGAGALPFMAFLLWLRYRLLSKAHPEGC